MSQLRLLLTGTKASTAVMEESIEAEEAPPIMCFYDRRQVGHYTSQTKELVYNVLKFSQQEASRNKLAIDLKKVQKRVAAMTGLSLATIKRIAKEGRQIESGSKAEFSNPTKKARLSCSSR